MIRVSRGRLSLAAVFSLVSVLGGCGGGGMEEVPKDVGYVAPLPTGSMKPAPKGVGSPAMPSIALPKR